MCEQVLCDTLEGKIQVKHLLKWLVNRNPEDTSFNYLTSHNCHQSDFITFFLNHIHEIQVSGGKTRETPQKVASTPKRLEHTKEPNSETLVTPKVKRRSALFSNSNAQDQNELPECTPKTKIHLEESYASPISPLYSRHSVTTPRDKYPVHSSPKTTPNLCLGDFITYKGSSKKRAQKNLNENLFLNEENSLNSSRGRRINPTNLTQRKCNTSFRKSGNSFTFRNGTEELVDKSDQRSFLVEERLKIISRKDPGDNLPMLAVSKTLSLNRKNEIVPLLELVTFDQQLDILILIYCFLLDHSFVLNLTSELYFIICVLLSKEYEEDTSPNNSSLGVEPLLDDSHLNYDKLIFKTIHNRVYFAARVLEKQTVVNILDRSILRLLFENRRLQQFSNRRFLASLLQSYEHKADRLTETSEPGNQTNVCFISDTDNRDNFPSDPSFHAFRKQRDLFYEILRIWENNHLQNEWNFGMAVGGKIKALLNMHSDPANLVHFARLFKAQLLMNACGKNVEDDVLAETHLSFLSSIPNINTEKLFRLKSRIVSKQICGGINSVPTFTGCQEFYRDFLVVAANYAFNKHLNDALISEIVELNDTKFNFPEDDLSSEIDSSMQKSYLLCVKSLRILAKFLGFLESLPYKSECVQLPENVVSSQIRIRDKSQPNMTLKQILTSAVMNKNLILTIPWITKYLAMLDYVTLRLPYYEEICHKLFKIYYTCSNSTEANGKRSKPSSMKVQSTFLVKLCLGWLFELPHFPEGRYYAWISQNSSTSLESPKHQRNPSFLDKLDIVDQNVLHVCCPYLQEIKAVLSNDANLSNSTNVTVKHITPLSALESPTNLSNKRIQLQLEEAFFNGQPVSVRKTIEFISERVASACVKEICNEIVPAYKKNAVRELKELLNASAADNRTDECALLMVLHMKTSEFAASCIRSLRLEIDGKLKAVIKSRVSVAIGALLAADVLPQTKDVCVSIAARMCMERVQQWINSHINLGIFTKDFDSEVKRLTLGAASKHSKPKPVFMLPTFGKSVDHNPSSLSGIKIAENTRSLSWMFLESPARISTDMVTDLLDSVCESLAQRCDLNECILGLVNKMLVEMILLLIAHRPDLLNDTITQKSCQVWKASGISTDELFVTLVSPRNVAILMQSRFVEITWSCFFQFVSVLLREKLLTCDMLETQAVAVSKQISNKVTLKWLSDCLGRIVNDYNKTVENPHKFVALLNFLTEDDLTIV